MARTLPSSPERMRWAAGPVAIPVLSLFAFILLSASASVAPARAQNLVPNDFFNAPFDSTKPSEVEADQLVFDAASNTVTASGDVVLGQSGYVLSGQNLIYNRSSGDLVFTGDVVVRDPSGNLASMPNLQVNGPLKRAFLESLTIVAYDGSRITAESMEYDEALQTLLVNATYSPCGDCVDEQGNRVGWSVRASRIVYNAVDGSIAFDQPQLSLLGIPVAWLPYLWLPDLSESALSRVRSPSIDSSEDIGIKVEIPVTVHSSRYSDLIFSPALISRQGLLLGAEWIQRFDAGSFTIKASGLRQYSPTAFTYLDSQREWRGAMQTSGEFSPVASWKAGWSYSAFTDLAYFDDYRIDPRKAAVDEAYVTHVTGDTFVDARVQQFNILGKTALTRQQEQGVALPNIRFERRFALGPDAGQIEVTARLLGVRREIDSTTVNNGVPYVFGYAGNKLHGMLQVDWSSQWTIPAGLVISPFVGLRADVASYDGNSPNPSAPAASLLWTATPIAALDIRYPMVAYGEGITHFVEPIAQLVYRGSSTTLPGLTNDDSQSAVLNDTNIFTFNRFSGIDRQETGLRANVGGRYTANFADGSYVDLVAGQSFHLTGVNSYAVPGTARTGVGSGLDMGASYAVLGAYGSFTDGLQFGGKVQVDTGGLRIARGQLSASLSGELGSATLAYRYSAAVPQAGTISTEHEVGLELTVPVTEYISVTGSLYWDVTSNSWLQAGGGITYDDGYLVIGASASRNGPTHYKPDDTRIMATFQLKAPAGFNAGYAGDLPVPNFGGTQ